MRKTKSKKRIYIIAIIITAILGVSFISYPIVSSFVADYKTTKELIEYTDRMNQLSPESKKQKQEKTKKYNKKIQRINSGEAVEDVFSNNNKNKHSVFIPGEMIGYIIVPSIDLAVPIYEGTNDNVLSNGIGHLSSSSFPTEKKGSHVVLIGHNGMASAELFSNLHKVTQNDCFYISFLGDNIEYKINRILKVLPSKANQLIENDEQHNYCTLITCTPTPANNMRLLVRGERVKNVKNNPKINYLKQKINTQNEIILRSISIVIICFVVLILLFVIIKKKFTKKGKSK